MSENPYATTIALAGLAQAVVRVNDLATTGYLHTQDFEIAVRSLFKLNPDNVLDVFGGDNANLRTGFKTLIDLIENPRETKVNRHLFGYSFGVLHLQKRLSKDRRMLATLSQRLEQCQHQLEHFGPTHDNVIANLADIYSTTISTYPFRIRVMGEYQYLQQKRVADQVRVLLFAAIRAATLWRQSGGARWQLVFHKRRTCTQARTLLDALPSLH